MKEGLGTRRARWETRKVVSGQQFVLNVLAPNLFLDLILQWDLGPTGENIKGIIVFPAP